MSTATDTDTRHDDKGTIPGSRLKLCECKGAICFSHGSQCFHSATHIYDNGVFRLRVCWECSYNLHQALAMIDKKKTEVSF